MRKNICKLTGALIAAVMCISSLPTLTYAADTLNSYNFNDDTNGQTPAYIEGDAVISSKWLDATEEKTAAFTMPQGAQRTRFIAKVKAEDTFLLTLYDGADYEEIRVTPKSTDSAMLYAIVDDGHINVVFENELIENRKSHIITTLTKVQIKNVRIDNVDIGDTDISAMPVNLHMYIDKENIKLGYIAFNPDKDTFPAISATWSTAMDENGQSTYYNAGESVLIPEADYIKCSIAYDNSTVSLPAKKVSDLDVLIFDYPGVSTGYNSTTNKQGGITLKNTSGSSWVPEPAQPDWSEYDELVIRAVSKNATDRVYQANIYSKNPSNATSYFFTFFIADWGKSTYKDVILPIGGESSLDAASSIATWSQVTAVDLVTSLSTQQYEEELLNDTEKNTSIEYKGVFLRKKDALSEYSDKEYILNAQKRYTDTPDYAQSIIEKGHPRIFLTPDKLTQLKKDVVSDNYLKKIYTLLQNTVKESMKKAVTQGENGRAAEIAQAALIYNLSPDEELKKWIEDSTDALIASERNEWNYDSNSFLQVGDTMRAMALVYDWMYSHWDDERNLKMRNAIMHYGIEPTIRTLRAGKRWAGAGQGNWNQAILSGIGTGILSICDDESYSELTNEILERVIHSLFYGQRDFDENGAYAEGVAYWHYAMDTFIPFEAALSSICGTNSGLLSAEKMAKTGYFPVMLTGAQGIFSFADSFYPSNIRSAAFYRLSEYFDNPVFGAYQYRLSNAKTDKGDDDLLSLLFYDKAGYDDSEGTHMFQFYPGLTECFALKPGWGTYLGFKGGQNGISHSQLDIGTFVYDDQNVRWICDLGRDTYDDYNNKTKYYRNRAEGNNCIVINPDGQIDQIKDAKADVTEYKVGKDAAYAVTDMSAAYANKAKSVKRGFMMTDNYETLIIQDEITAEGTLETVYSFMHTHQNIELSDDGESAVLTCSDGRVAKVYVTLLSNCGAKLQIMEPELLSGEFPQGQFGNEAYKKLAVKAQSVENPTFTVVISRSQTPSYNSIIPVNKWGSNFDFGETMKIKASESVLSIFPETVSGCTLATQYLDGSVADGITYSLAENYQGISINGNEILVSDNADAVNMTVNVQKGSDRATLTIPMKKDYTLLDGDVYVQGSTPLTEGEHTVSTFYEDSTLSENGNVYIAHFRGKQLLKVGIDTLASTFIKGDKVRIFIWKEDLIPIIEEKTVN